MLLALGSFHLGHLAWVSNSGHDHFTLLIYPPGKLAWRHAAGSSCFSVTLMSCTSIPLADNNLAPLTGLACGRQCSGPGQHLATRQAFLPHVCLSYCA